MSSGLILVPSCVYLFPKKREVKVATFGRRKTDINLLPEQLDVQAGTLHLPLHLPALSVVRTVLTQEQADYFGVSLLSCKVQLKCCRLQRFRIVRVSWIHCAGVPKHKNPSRELIKWLGIAECRVHSAQIRAELSSNGSSRPASDKNPS